MSDLDPDRALPLPAGSNLSLALAGAAENAVIHLAAGLFTLDQPLVITRGITLCGAGIDATWVHSTAVMAAIQVCSEGRFQAQDLSFAHVGLQWAHVADIEARELVIERCRFRDGLRPESGEDLGDGLRIRGRTAGLIADCEFVENGGNGLSLGGTSNIRVERCQFLRNHGSGASCSEATRGRLRHNHVQGNLYGITVFKLAAPQIKDNVVTGHTRAGLAYFDDTAGLAQDNQIEDNRDGISIADRAHPSIVRNKVSRNRENAVSVSGTATPMVGHNGCRGNGWFGIMTSEEAAPILLCNSLIANRRSGLAFLDRAGGQAEANVCERNFGHGIEVLGDALPALRHNHLLENRWDGLAYHDQSGGIAECNAGERNGGSGITVRGDAVPTLERNALRLNGEYGLAYHDRAGGSARANRLAGNSLGDFRGTKATQSFLETNRIGPAFGAESPAMDSALKAARNAALARLELASEPLVKDASFLRLEPGGDLAAAVRAIAPGGVIELAEGLHALRHRLDVNKPLTIRGMGPELTQLIGRGEGVLRLDPDDYKGENLDRETLLVGLTIEGGDTPGCAVHIVSGDAAIYNVVITGARRRKRRRESGHGILLEADARLILREDCRCLGNHGYGLAYYGDRPPNVNGADLSGNDKGPMLAIDSD